MNTTDPIYPNNGAAQTLVTGAASAAITGLPENCRQLFLTAIAQNCYVRVTAGSDTSAATTADFLVVAGQSRLISKGDLTRLAAIAPGGAGSLHVMPCNGASSD